MPVPEDESGVTLSELRRNIRDMRQDYERGIQEYRADTQKTLGDMQRTVDRLLDNIQGLPFVRQDVYEERQKTTGQRLEKIEGTISKINFTAWTGVILPLTVMIFGAVLLAAVNLK